MVTADFSMSPLQAAAYREADCLSAGQACRLAMNWLEAGSESTAVAALALEDPGYVSWSDISVLFAEALEESGVGRPVREKAAALRLQALLNAFLGSEVAAGDLYSWSGLIGVAPGEPVSERLGATGFFCVALELDEAMTGGLVSDRSFGSLVTELQEEAVKLKARIEQECLGG